MKIYFISLGCPKNLTDTEVLMGKLVSSGHEITSDPSEAEMIIINTCAFLKSAREEAVTVIKEMAEWKKKGKCRKLFIAGCLPKLPLSLWERGLGGEGIDGIINSLGLFDCRIPRIKATPPWYAYVKIAEGCNNRCSYCLIPKIRGKLRFRKIEDILKEVGILAKRGVKEIIFVAQDTTAFPDLAGLLQKTAKIAGLRWIRILYAHPAHLTDKVIETIARERKIVKYIDLPIQHACDKILELMGRRYARRDIETLIFKIRRRNIAFRSTVIAGFPGEGKAEFEELLGFIKKAKFQKLGVFAYQREEGTPAYKMRGQVSEKVKRERVKRLMRAQARVSGEHNQKMIGKTMEVLIERASRGGFVGRSCMDAPDIDGSVFVKSNPALRPGEIVRVRVTGAKTYDLIGQVT